MLVIINVQGTILDNETFHSIGATCGQLRELNAAGSTLTDAGLQLLQGAAPRLLSLDISATRTSALAVASATWFLVVHGSGSSSDILWIDN